jgi:hypothetical protein
MTPSREAPQTHTRGTLGKSDIGFIWTSDASAVEQEFTLS